MPLPRFATREKAQLSPYTLPAALEAYSDESLARYIAAYGGDLQETADELNCTVTELRLRYLAFPVDIRTRLQNMMEDFRLLNTEAVAHTLLMSLRDYVEKGEIDPDKLPKLVSAIGRRLDSIRQIMALASSIDARVVDGTTSYDDVRSSAIEKLRTLIDDERHGSVGA